MAKQFYLPRTDQGKVTWLNKFAAKKEEHAATFDFSPAEVASTQEDALMFAWIIAVIQQNRDDMKEFTDYKNILRDGPKSAPTNVIPDFTALPPPAGVIVDAFIFERVGRDVAYIKAHENYNTALGKDFGIIGSDSAFDAPTFKAEIKAKVEPGQVRIEWVKSETDGYRIYTRLKGEGPWEFLALDTRSPYIDTRPLADPEVPEIREYRGRAIINDEEIGLFSEIAEVTFGG